VKNRRVSFSRRTLTGVATAAFAFCSVVSATLAAADHDRDRGPVKRQIKHVVIIFQENASFDHYFATYPDAENTDGVRFVARADMPTVNGLTDGNSLFPERVNVGLHDFNPNTTVGLPTGLNPNGGANPFSMTRDQIVTCSNNHDYKGEQLTTNSGFMDKFPQQNATNGPGCATDGSTVMGYFDGNTVTAMWNWAQRFSMSDNSWGTTYGPSTPGAINLVSGQTAGAVVHAFSGTKGPTGQLTDSIQSMTIPDVVFVGPGNLVGKAGLLGSAQRWSSGWRVRSVGRAAFSGANDQSAAAVP